MSGRPRRGSIEEEPAIEDSIEEKPKVEKDGNRLKHLKLVEIDKWSQDWNQWVSAGISSFDASSVMDQNRYKKISGIDHSQYSFLF